MSEMMLELSGIEKGYNRGKPSEVLVLRGASLSVAKGEVVALVAPSGAGKSTLLHIAGLLDTPDTGTVRLGGREMGGLSDKARTEARRADVGFIYQFHHLLPEFTALENVCMPLLIRGTPIAQARALATELLGRVGLAARIAHKPGELSGGERQRAAVARALVTRPACVLGDEPTGNLDEANAAQVYELMLELNREIGTALILVTHDRGLAARMDRMFELRGGILHELDRNAASQI